MPESSTEKESSTVSNLTPKDVQTLQELKKRLNPMPHQIQIHWISTKQKILQKKRSNRIDWKGENKKFFKGIWNQLVYVKR